MRRLEANLTHFLLCFQDFSLLGVNHADNSQHNLSHGIVILALYELGRSRFHPRLDVETPHLVAHSHASVASK